MFRPLVPTTTTTATTAVMGTFVSGYYVDRSLVAQLWYSTLLPSTDIF